MHLSQKFISFIITLGVIQGILLSVILILKRKKKNKSLLFLILFITLFSLESIPNILKGFTSLNEKSELLLPTGLYFLTYPFLLVYVESLLILKNLKKTYWSLIPGFFELIIAIAIFLLPLKTKLLLKDSHFTIVYLFLGVVYSLVIVYLLLKQINKYFQRDKRDGSLNKTAKILIWCKRFIHYSLVYYFLIIVNFFIYSNVLELITCLFNVILIYWISTKVILQELINKKDNLPVTENKNTDTSNSLNKNSLQLNNGFMTDEDAKNTYETVKRYIESSKCFKNNSLTIIHVAEAVNIHPKRISYAINTIELVNFNNYINSYRIDLAKQILESNQAKTLTIEGVGKESGFRSKTTIYKAIKKSENMTPAQYKSYHHN